MEEKEINLYDCWLVIKKNRRLIIGLFLTSVFVAMVISLLMPKTYRATATIMPPAETAESGGLAGLMNVSGISGLTPQANTSDIFVAILESRSMADEIINRFNLQNLYECKTRQDTRKILEKKTEIKVSKKKVISVDVLDRNPQRAADIANFYVSALDHLNQNLNITVASKKKKFIEARLEETRQTLKKAEEKLQSYQVNHKILAEGGIQSAANTAGDLQGRLIAARIELEAMKKYTTSKNPDRIKLQNEVAEIEKSVTGLPPLGTELAQLIRETKSQETVYALLISQYEQAKIDETRNTPTVQVLDRATVPEKKYKPKPLTNMALSGLTALLLGILISFFRKAYQKEHGHEK